MESLANDEGLRCSFCYKSESDVQTLISNPAGAGVRAYICNECVESCHFLLEHASELPRHPVAGRPTCIA